MHPLHPRIAVLPLVLATAAAFGCGSGASADRTVDQGHWSTAVCVANGRWLAAIKQPGNELDGLALEFKYGLPKQSKSRATELRDLAALSDSTRQLRDDYASAGIPQAANGARLKREMLDSVDEIDASLATLTTRAQALPQGDGRAQQSALLTPDIESAFQHMSTRLRGAWKRDAPWFHC